MSWDDLKELMLAEYCPRCEMRKLEQELWILKMKGSDIAAYTARFSDLTLLSPGLVTSESKKVERYIWGLSPPNRGNVLAVEPHTIDSAKHLEQALADHRDSHNLVLAAPEPQKEGSGKRKF